MPKTVAVVPKAVHITPGTAIGLGVAAGLGTMNDPLIHIGQFDHRGQPMPFGLSAADARQHLYLIGKTGSGKTTLLRNLLVQHIAAGHGVGLIDPHGDLAEELLNHIPPSRADHLVYFNPGDLEFPIGLNLLANVPPDDRHLVASGIVGAFKGIWRDSWGPRLEYILYNAIAALLDCQNTTLLGVNRLLTDTRYRAWVVRQIQDPFIRDFWENEYEGSIPFTRSTFISAELLVISLVSIRISTAEVPSDQHSEKGEIVGLIDAALTIGLTLVSTENSLAVFQTHKHRPGGE